MQLDITRLPTDPIISQILACELLPLFMNSLHQVQNRYVSTSQTITSMVVMERDLMMRFSPPTEITPEPTPEFVLNYDASCLPSVTALPMPTPSPTPPQNEDESRMLVNIPPMLGEFIQIESWQQQAQPVFLMVDMNVDNGALSVCDANISSDCSLRGAISRANSDLSNHHVIQIPNNTYILNGTLTLSGHITLVGEDFYIQPQQARAIIQPNMMTGSLFSITNANVALYNLTFKNGTNGMVITGSQVGIYHSRFDENSAGLTGGAISIIAPNITSLRIVDTVFTQNGAPYGGAIAIDADAQTSDLSINCSTFDRNFAEYGGVIYTSSRAQIVGEIRYSNFYNNTAIFSGGAIYSAVNSVLQIRWSYATSPTFSGFANYHAPNSIIHAPMAIESYNEPVLFDPHISDCYIPPPPTPTLTVADYINELAKYGIIAFAGGVPPQPIDVWDRINQQYITANWNSAGATWTVQELQEILQGVYDTAEAFYLLKYGVSSGEAGNGPNTQRLFKKVMSTQGIWRDGNGVIHDGFFLLRVQNTFVYSTADLCNGSGDEGCTSNNWGTIGLYGNYSFNNPNSIKYTLVHELGHRFDNQSGVGGTKRLSNYVDGQVDDPNNIFVNDRVEIVIEDCNENRVMGRASGAGTGAEWVRGYRGWGDVATFNNQTNRFNLTIFQRNPLEVSFPSDQTVEIEEASADMFLNWVYRRITDRWTDISRWVDFSDKDGIARDTNNTPLYCGLPNFYPTDWNNEVNPDEAWRLLHNLSTTWLGFRNIAPDRVNETWVFTSPIYDFDLDLFGTFRSSLSGNARYWWMEKTLKNIFNQKPTWN